MEKIAEIRNLIRIYGIKESWLSKQLEIKKATLHYILYECDRIDEQFYKKILEAIQSFQIEFEFEEEIEPDLFNVEEINKGIGDRIRIFAKRKFGTLKKLSEKMEMSPQQLQQYISGTREPGSRVLIRLMKLGCDLNWLLGGKDSSESYKIYRLENEIKNLHKNIQQISNIISEIQPK